MKLNGFDVACPGCGSDLHVTLTLGRSERREDGSVQVPIGFDEQDFKTSFEAHILADPAAHQWFVTVGGSDSGNRGGGSSGN